MEQPVAYSLKRNPRAKSLRVSVYADGRCVVSAPVGVADVFINAFVAKKSEWISNTLRGFMPFRQIVRRRNSRTEYMRYKEAARELVTRRLPELNTLYGFKIGKIAIKNQKSRWGSCSTRGNLNFNYKIVLLPSHLADYLMVHELCHLGEFNHSRAFWDLVARAVPDYKKFRAELHKHGRSL